MSNVIPFLPALAVVATVAVAKPSYHFEIYQALPGGLVSIDAVVPEAVAAAMLKMLDVA
jgi:hypothetical protein